MRANISIGRLIGGIIICLGLGGIRFWASNGSPQGGLLAGAMLAVEVGLVILLELATAEYVAQLIYYHRLLAENEREQSLVDAATTCADRSGSELEDIRKKIEAIHEHIRDRISRVGQAEHQRELAVKTILDGYNAGLDEQEGRFHTPWKYSDEDGNGEED